MASFKLTADNGVTYDLDTQGTASAGGQRVGTWTTDARNAIVITPTTGAATAAEAEWRFTDENHLTLHDDSGELCDFGADAPAYALVGNALEVQPGDSVAFKFRLYPKWSLDSDNNLVFEVNGTQSTLKGYVDDSSSRFIFWFEDQSQALPEYMLVFQGRWDRAAGDKAVNLVFRGQVTGTTHKFAFSLQKGDTYVDPASNHLVIEYQSSQGLKRVELRGSLSIIEKPGKKLGLSFAIAEQRGLEGGVLVESREIKVDTTFEFDRLTGQLQLYVGKVRTAASQKLTIGGTFEARLGTVGLEIGFLYQRQTFGGQPPITAVVSLAVNCAFTFKNGKILFTYLRAGKSQTFEVKGELVFGKVGIDLGVVLTNDPGGRVVKGFLGISW